MHGGGGLRLQNSNLMLLEDVAIDVPGIQSVIAHPGWPWQDEALSGSSKAMPCADWGLGTQDPAAPLSVSVPAS